MNRYLPNAERRFTGEYAPDGKARREAARAEAGHRCVRCGHPYRAGQHGGGEWSPCDEKCTHGGEVRIGGYHAHNATPEWVQRKVREGKRVEARWRILTVHHLDGNKANDAWWNTLPLDQRCHLTVQCRVDPDIPWFLEHSPWFRIFVAGFYAKKYEGKDITREEAEERLEELLAYELKAS